MQHKITSYAFNSSTKNWNITNFAPLLQANGIKFKLQEFHIHQPGEHTIYDHSFPLELHFVYQVTINAVVFSLALGFLAKLADKSSNFFVDLINNTKTLRIPNMRTPLWEYVGSLTTAPLPSSTNVIWFVRKNSLDITNHDLQTLQSRSKASRSLQPRGGRPVNFVCGCYL